MQNIDVRSHLKLELDEIGCSFNMSAMQIYWVTIILKAPIEIVLDPTQKNWNI